MMFDPGWRQRALASLDWPFDLVIIGGGITGCGILFDAAQRGLRVLLIDQGDIASGTSSRSSKLVHGGLRYLKHMQLGLTRQSCRERDLQLHLSPHLVTPLPWLYPTYAENRPPSWQIRLGLGIYDRLTTAGERHTTLDDAEALARTAPGLRRDDLERAFLYRDARTDDARLTLAVAATGAACGGLVITYASAEAVRRDSRGVLRALVVRDLESGATHEVETPLVVNATGAWVDRVRHQLGFDGQTVRPSRGSHVLFDRQRLPVTAAVTLTSPDDSRPVFCIPHPEGVLVGTTDLHHEGPIDDPRPTRGEVDYLLRAVASTFPTSRLGLEHVRGAFAGVRPVLANQAADPSAASRDEAIWFEDGVLSVAGGKLTTWRSTAEEVIDQALRRLPSARARRAAPCATAGTPLAGRAPHDLDQRLHSVHGVEPEIASAMARRLAKLAWTACERLSPEAFEPLAPGLDICAAEVRAHLRFSAVVHLSDLVIRRLRLGMWRPDLALELAPRLAELSATELDWNAARRELELERLVIDIEGWSPSGIVPSGVVP